MTMKYKAVCFDFDYTLANSSIGIVKCFRLVFDKHGWTDISDETVRKTIGMTLEDAFSSFTGITDANQLANLHIEYSQFANDHMNPNTYLYPETLPLLQKMKKHGIQSAIVSTKNKSRIEDFLREHKMDEFVKTVIGIYEVSEAKPNPEGLFLAIEHLGVDKSEVLYVGDSIIDAQTAMNAGVDFCGVTTGTTNADELKAYPHIAILDNLDNLHTILQI